MSRALREMSRALHPLSAESAGEVNDVAKRLEAADSSSLAHGALIKEGLHAFLAAMLGLPAPSSRQEEYRAALQSLAQAMKGIKMVAPLSEQRTAIVSAFRGATDAVHLAHGKDAPFRVRATRSAHEPLSVEIEVERDRVRVLELARARWTDARERASLALQALADVIRARGREQNARARASELRLEAERLRDETRSALGQPESVQTRPEHCPRVPRPHQGRTVTKTSNWTRLARQSVATIDERSSNRPAARPIQDAFRATVDAFAAELSAAVGH